MVAKIATGEIEDTKPKAKDEAAANLGRKGAQARSAKLSPEKRAEIARKAALSRWKHHK
jgi:hypothetical protein